MDKIALLWKSPEINPINRKARSIPVFNPVNIYGRVFTFSWFGFLIAFLSWYAFPPLMTKTIKQDLHLTQNQIANSNIAALTATLLVRFACGPLCDKFGPRKVFAGVLLLGSIPTVLAGTVKNAGGLITIRFFVGILGGSFVPCQVWSTGFFDKNVVGTSNALIGGWGNAGGGITYFVMPAIFDSLVHERGLTPHKAWRVAFIIPFIFITSTAVLMLLLCPDTPSGKWADRHNALQQHIEEEHKAGHKIVASGAAVDFNPHAVTSSTTSDDKKKSPTDSQEDIETAVGETTVVSEYNHEIVQAPTTKEIVKVCLSAQSIMLAACYFCSFGAELAINSVLGAYYTKNFPRLGQTQSGRWAAMFGLLNVYGRPLGGVIGDLLYKYTNGSLWAKKVWIHFVGIMTGVFCIVIGVLNPHDLPTMIGLVAGLAFFMDAGNGANFALVPHVHPFANGIVSGLTGATGNFGGVIFAIIFRYHGTNYAKVMWIIGVMTIAINLSVCWIRPIPKGQIGGR